MLNVSYFDVEERGVAQARKDSRFSWNTIPYRLDSRANTGRRYHSILNGLKKGASAVSEKTLLGESKNLGNVSPITQPIFLEETAPMKRLEENIDVLDKSVGVMRFEKIRAIKLADSKKMFSNTVRNAASAYAVRDRDNKLPENVETTVFAPQGFVPEIPPIVPPAIDVQKIVDNNEGVLANNVNLAMEQGAIPVAPTQEEINISNDEIEDEIGKALADVVNDQSVVDSTAPVVNNVISPSEVNSVVNGESDPVEPINVFIYGADGGEYHYQQNPGEGPTQTIIYPDNREAATPVEPINTVIYGADGGEYHYQQNPGEEPTKTIIYPDNREAATPVEPINTVIYGADGGEYHYQQNPGEEPTKTIIYPDNREAATPVEPINTVIYGADGGEYHYQQNPGEEPTKTIIYPDDREDTVEEVPITVTVDPKEVFIYGADGTELYYQQDPVEHSKYQVHAINDNIRGGVVAPDRDEVAVSENVLNDTSENNNSIIKQLKEKAERLRKANRDRTSSLNNLIDTRSQKQDYVSQIQQTLDATKKEVIERYQSLVDSLENEGEEIDNERRNLENDLASLDEEQVATENAIASYERELEELDSIIGGKSR